MSHRGSGLRAVGPVLVPGVIDVGIVKRDQVGALRRRQAQPGNHLIDALVIGKVIVEIQVIGGAAAVNLGLRAGPEEARAAHALLLRQHPQRRASVPAAVTLRRRIAVGIKLLADRVIELVGHNAVVLGVKSGDQGVVIGEGQRRIGRDHSLSGDRAFGTQLQQMFGAVLFGVVVAKAVERHQHHVRLGLLGLGIRSVIDRNYRGQALRG